MIRIIIASDLRGEGSTTIANQVYFALKEKGFNVKVEGHVMTTSKYIMSHKFEIDVDPKKEIVIFDTINGKDNSLEEGE